MTRTEKFCTDCEETKPLEEFGKDRQSSDGLRHYCRACNTHRAREYQKSREAEDPQAYRAERSRIGRNYKQQDPETFAKRVRESKIRSKYGMSEEDYSRLFDLQFGRCAICVIPLSETRTQIDHDHTCCSGNKTCGECVRGILCSRCNMALGLLLDDQASLERALIYLKNGGVK